MPDPRFTDEELREMVPAREAYFVLVRSDSESHIYLGDLARALLAERRKRDLDVEALIRWHGWCHDALDEGYVLSMPGNEIPWGLSDARLAKHKEDRDAE